VLAAARKSRNEVGSLNFLATVASALSCSSTGSPGRGAEHKIDRSCIDCLEINWSVQARENTEWLIQLLNARRPPAIGSSRPGPAQSKSDSTPMGCVSSCYPPRQNLGSNARSGAKLRLAAARRASSRNKRALSKARTLMSVSFGERNSLISMVLDSEGNGRAFIATLGPAPADGNRSRFRRIMIS
jgi:hypothetical protein